MAAKLKLNDGNFIPQVGLGTFQGNYDYKSVFDQVVKSVRSAMEVGYRHFDTAFIYDTEKGLGEAVKQKITEGAVKREDLFITTKLWSTYHRRELVVPGLKKSLESLNMDYVDLLLVHWPCAIQPSTEIFPKDEEGNVLFEDDRTSLLETWQGMEECKKLGLAKSIGVSNYNHRQMQTIVDGCNIKPAVLQVESNPFFSNEKLVRFCQEHGIVVGCFSPLGKPSRQWDTDGPFIFSDPIIQELAKKYKKSTAQIALRFQVDRGNFVVPKSNSAERQRENLEIFDFQLSEEDIAKMHKCNMDFRVLKLEHVLGGSKEFPFREEW